MSKDIAEKRGQYKQALNFLNQHRSLSDSIKNEEVRLSQDVLQVRYETEKKENEISQLNAAALEDQSKIDRQRTLLGGSLLGLSFIGFLAFNLFRNNQRKRKTNELLAQKNNIIQAKSDQNELLLKEIHHRVKNNLQTISSLLYLQSSSLEDEGAKEAMTVGQQRVESMALIHKNLYQGQNLGAIEMKDYLGKLVNNLKDSYGNAEKEISLSLDMPETELDVDSAIPVGLIANELITNSYKYAFKGKDKGEIKVSLNKLEGGKHEFIVSDNGIGNSHESEGFGTRLVDLLRKQLGGEAEEENQNGYRFKMVFG